MFSRIGDFIERLIVYAAYGIFVVLACIYFLAYSHTPNVFRIIAMSYFSTENTIPLAIPPEEAASAMQRMRDFLSGGVGILVFLLGTIVPLALHYRAERKRSRTSSLRTVGLDQGDYLRMMEKACRVADGVTIFSGDFSFAHGKTQIGNQLVKLGSENKLTFISYKSEADVRNAAGNEEGRKFIDELASVNKIFFNSGVDLKFLIYESSGTRYLLYRYQALFQVSMTRWSFFKILQRAANYFTRYIPS